MSEALGTSVIFSADPSPETATTEAKTAHGPLSGEPSAEGEAAPTLPKVQPPTDPDPVPSHPGGYPELSIQLEPGESWDSAGLADFTAKAHAVHMRPSQQRPRCATCGNRWNISGPRWPEAKDCKPA